MSRRRTQRGVLWVMLAASAAAHLLIAQPLHDFLAGFLFVPASGPPPPVRVVALSPEQWSQNVRTRSGVRPPADTDPTREVALAEPSAEASVAPSPSPTPSPSERARGQVVDVPPTADDTADPNAKFLSRHNSRVEKETVARLDQRDRKLGRVTPKLQREGDQAPAAVVPQTPLSPKKGDDRMDDAPKVDRQRRLVFEVPEILRREGLDLRQFPSLGPSLAPRAKQRELAGTGSELDVQLGQGTLDREAEAAGEAGARGGTGDREVPTLQALMPTMGTLDRITGSPREAALDGVEEGDGTFLNTKEFKYATFFLRVRDAVQDQWEDAVSREYRRRDPMGHIYGTRDRNTLLAVTLRPGGELADIQVSETSGVDFLDNVAMDAFRRAQPFLNPPAGIVEEDGLIRLNFMFKIAVGPQNPFEFRGIGP